MNGPTVLMPAYFPNYVLILKHPCTQWIWTQRNLTTPSWKPTKKYIAEKFAGIDFDGVMVTDNDALDFAMKYKSELFPEIPIVFAGISNPKDYPLESNELFGFEETANSDSAFYLIRKILPDVKKIFVLVDNTTTGKVYRKDFSALGLKYKDLTIEFPDSSNLSSIYAMDFEKNDYDAVFYSGITQDEDGGFIDPVYALKKIESQINVPLFSNDPKYLGYGVMGGIFQSGVEQGNKMADLMMFLVNKENDRSNLKHIHYTRQNYFFDYRQLEKYNISPNGIPAESFLYYEKESSNRKYYKLFIGVVAGLMVIILTLSALYVRRKKAEKKTRMQIDKIELQKKQLEEAHEKLSLANQKLNESNLNLAEAKKKAEESDKLKSAFLANVSHEIRTPLNSIVGFSSLLTEPDLDQNTRKAYADLVESNTESLLVLIDEIIDLSKIEAQQLSIKKQDFSVDALIDELFQMFSLNQQNPEIRLNAVKISPEMELFVNSDRVRVRQIFINLLSNAFKFTERGLIEFGYFEPKPKEIIFYVKDSGIGIAKEHHHAIFQRFRKLNEGKNKRVYRGTGLGLAITQKLVELLGGRIWIESAIGVGSTFYFTLKNPELKKKKA